MTLLKKIVILIFIGLAFQATGQELRYTGRIFEKVDTFKNVEYAQAEWLNNPLGIELLSEYNIHDGEQTTAVKPLLMDIFVPAEDTVSKKPAIIFSHSGAFLIGSRLADDMVAFCDSFARKGYVTATIDYRIGMGAAVTRLWGSIIIGLSVDEENAHRAAYRATQDGRAAIRYLKQNADLYGIDSSRVFLVGSSAGAIQNLSVLYLDQPHEIPDNTQTTPSLGGIDDVGPAGPDGNPDAVVAMWGAAWNTEYIENKQTPLLLMHGENDNIVPLKKGIPLDGTVPDNPLVSFNMPETYGSFCIDTALTNRGIPHETYFVKDKGHEFYGVDTGMFPAEGPNEYWNIVHQKIADFLFKQIKPEVDFDFTVNENSLTTFNYADDDYFVSWDFGDGTTSRSFEPEHIYTQKGKYKVSLKVCNEIMACDTVSKQINVDVISGIEAYQAEKIRLYPNPVSSELKISGMSSPFSIRLFDLTGRQKFQIENTTQNRIDLSSLNPGIYILQIEFGENSIVRKISITE